MQLISAAERGDLEELRRELAAGALVDIRDLRSGWTPLLAAAASVQANEETLRLLLAWLLTAGCNPNATNSSGQTPLMLAVQVGAADTVRLLLAAGASIDRVDQFENTPWPSRTTWRLSGSSLERAQT